MLFTTARGRKEEKRRTALAGARGELEKDKPGADDASKAGKDIKKAEKGKSVFDGSHIDGFGEYHLGGIEQSNQRRHLSAFPEIASLAGCLSDEEALGNEGTDKDKTRRHDDLVVAIDRARSVFFADDDKSTQKVALDLTTYKGVQEAFFGRELSSDYMSIPLPRNIHTVTDVSLGTGAKKLFSVIKKRLHINGEVLSKKALFSSNVENIQLKSLEPLCPPGVGLDTPFPFRELKLTVIIGDKERQGTFDELVPPTVLKNVKESCKAIHSREHILFRIFRGSRQYREIIVHGIRPWMTV